MNSQRNLDLYLNLNEICKENSPNLIGPNRWIIVLLVTMLHVDVE
jgi:hypothetical protein